MAANPPGTKGGLSPDIRKQIFHIAAFTIANVAVMVANMTGDGVTTYQVTATKAPATPDVPATVPQEGTTPESQ